MGTRRRVNLLDSGQSADSDSYPVVCHHSFSLPFLSPITPGAWIPRENSSFFVAKTVLQFLYFSMLNNFKNSFDRKQANFCKNKQIMNCSKYLISDNCTNGLTSRPKGSCVYQKIQGTRGIFCSKPLETIV